MLRLFALIFVFGLQFAVACLGQDGAAAAPSKQSSSELGEAVRLSDILILTPQPYDPAQVASAKSKAEELLSAIRHGTAFADVAKNSSEGPTAKDGGGLGVFRRGELAPPIEEIVFQLKVGEVSEVIRTRQGFVIFQVTGRSTLDTRLGSAPEPANENAALLEDYMKQVKEKINGTWSSQMPPAALPPARKAGTVQIRFEIGRDGALAKLTILSSSGDSALDQAALLAVRQAAPFAPLADVTRQDHIEVRTRFEYNPQPSP